MSMPLPASGSVASRRAWLSYPFIVLAVALGLTAASTFFVHRTSVARHEALVSTAIATEVGSLRTRLDAYAALLRATRSFVLTEGESLNRARFKDYVDALNIQKEFPGIRAIGYSPRIEMTRVNAFEAAARADGVADFRVAPSAPRDWAFSILYLEPLDERNRAALGFDMFSEPVRAQAMTRARDTGSLAMTGAVVLKQEITADKQAGFLIYKPLYSAGPPPSSVNERRQRLTGYVYAPFRAPDFFKGLFDGSATSLRARVYASASPNAAHLLVDTATSAGIDQAKEHIRTMEFGGQVWTLAFVEGGGEAVPFEEYLPHLTALAGVAISLLLFALTRVQFRAAERSEQQARTTASALEGERAQRQVAQSLSELALAFGSEPDTAKLLQRVTDECTRLTGAAFGAYFHNQPDDTGKFGLYTLSGAPIEAFSKFPPLRPTPLFLETFQGRTVRLDDVRQSPLFAKNPPYNGMPHGHPPVVSYLGVCVRTRSGKVLGGLFLGHPEPGRFLPEHERLVEGLAAQAAVVLENHELLQTERDAHARTEEQKALLDLVISQSGEGIIAADATGTLRIFNPAAERQHGATHQEVAAPDWAATYGLFTLDGEPLALPDTPLFKAIHGHSIIDARWKVHRPDGSQRTLSGTAMPLRRGDGSSAGAVLVTRDETERLAAEREREALMDALSRSNKELDQFAYVTSHDLKAPLRGIANLSQWIEEDLGPEQAAKIAHHSRMLQGRVHRMEALIDGILLYSRAGRVGMEHVPVDVRALLDDVIEMASPSAGVSVTVAEGMPSLVTDRIGLQQVFMNLVGNALKHAARENAVVDVAVADAGAMYRFSIKDNGPGIAEQYHERIWGIFQTLEARDKVEGTGIGLSIVRKTVEAHGGRAWVESAEGHGATFYFTWPKQHKATP